MSDLGNRFSSNSGRAIAIASYQDNFEILILNESMSRVRFDPIIGVRYS
jgi:hypothetical protein